MNTVFIKINSPSQLSVTMKILHTTHIALHARTHTASVTTLHRCEHIITLGLILF